MWAFCMLTLPGISMMFALVYQTEKDGGKMWKDIGVFIRVDFYIIHGFLSRGVTELYISIFINIIDNIDLIHIP